MPALRTVHRHGNHNYFKATFMWYHTDVNERILPEPGEEEEEDDDLSPSEGRKDGGETSQRKVKKQNCTGIRMAKGSLQYLAAYSIVSSRYS